MTAIPQLLRNARRKVLRYSFNLMLSWYEATQFNPTESEGLPATRAATATESARNYASTGPPDLFPAVSLHRYAPSR